MIFLCAGASVPFGISDSKNLALNLENDLNKNFKIRLREIGENINKQFLIRYEIEAYLQGMKK